MLTMDYYERAHSARLCMGAHNGGWVCALNMLRHVRLYFIQKALDLEAKITAMRFGDNKMLHILGLTLQRIPFAQRVK